MTPVERTEERADHLADVSVDEMTEKEVRELCKELLYEMYLRDEDSFQIDWMERYFNIEKGPL